jgi:polar amino acid transport system substrate-binding protein
MEQSNSNRETTRVDDQLLAELAPTGVLRAAINMSNFLLVTGQTNTGAPDGESPDMAQAVAVKLGVDCKLIPYPRPGDLADALAKDAWDIGNIAAEPERAKTIAFSPPYCEIQATYLVPPGSPIRILNEVDVPGNRIAVASRSAYDLWLTDNIQHAELVRAPSLDESYTMFMEQQLEALAGLRPKLVEEEKKLPGFTLLEGCFTVVQQSIGCKPKNLKAAAFLKEFVQTSLANGFVTSLIQKHGVEGRLSVASSGA